MSKRNYAISSGSSFAGASVPNSANKPVWLTLTNAGNAASAMVRLYPGTASLQSNVLIALVASGQGTIGPFGPFVMAQGVYVDGPCPAGASAFISLGG